jgi:lysophospholipase L1-like esterase
MTGNRSTKGGSMTSTMALTNERAGRWRQGRRFRAVLLVIVIALTAASCGQAVRSSWSSNMSRANGPRYTFRDGFNSPTSLRHVVHTSRGGTSVRIRLSNLYGSVPLVIGAASIAPAAEPVGTTKAVTVTPTPLTFGGGNTSVTIPVGQRTTSDLIPYDIPSDHDVAVTLYFPEPTGTPTGHLYSLETSHTGPGNLTQNVDGTPFTGASTTNRYWLTGLDVVDPTSGGTVVTLGDSLTDGLGTSPDEEHRWPDFLYDALVTIGSPVRHVVNVGQSGGTLLGDTPNSGLSRFDIDVLRQPGRTSVIVALGLNDLNNSNVDAAQLAEGFIQLVERAHAAGVKIILATITPLMGPVVDPPVPPIPAEREASRQAINNLIRHPNHLGADAIVDFDAIVRDPDDPSRVNPIYSFFNGVHFNDEGNAALGLAAVTARDHF